MKETRLQVINDDKQVDYIETKLNFQRVVRKKLSKNLSD